ncbi:hypothetical protein EDC96DRAFT_537233 [Choanephora cucurbitarum]|nr:hypothetical protein EDC96DRAFT_537233 [Choanephora cucurbitarum]
MIVFFIHFFPFSSLSHFLLSFVISLTFPSFCIGSVEDCVDSRFIYMSSSFVDDSLEFAILSSYLRLGHVLTLTCSSVYMATSFLLE